jgi:hypothetical protein
MPEARRISDICRRKQKHFDIHNLLEACKKYPRIPVDRLRVISKAILPKISENKNPEECWKKRLKQ